MVGGELSASSPFDVREEDIPDPEILYDRVRQCVCNTIYIINHWSGYIIIQ